MHELEATTKETQSFYDSTTKLNKTVQIAVMLLISVPIVQLVFATLMVYYLGIQDDLNGLLHWLLGSISFFSVIELLTCMTGMPSVCGASPRRA